MLGRWRQHPPYYGWIITVTLAFTETISWGVLYYAFTVFLRPMEGELGWSRAELTGGFSLALLVMGGMAYPVGVWIDRRGARGLMTIGSILASALVVSWAQVEDLTSFYLIWFGLGVCGAAILYEPAFTIVTAWFVRGRSRALAIITFAAGLASTIFIPLCDLLLQSMGWRGAVLTLGLFMAITTIPLHALIIRRRPADLGLLPDGAAEPVESDRLLPDFSLSQALHENYFWLLTLAFSLSYLASSAIRVHFIPLLIDSGIDASTAALASGSIGLMQVAGRLVFAPIEARTSPWAMVTGVFVLQAASMFILLLGPALPIIGLFLVVYGTSFGAVTLARPAILADFFGAAHYGRISGIMAIFLTLASTIAPVGAGLAYDRFGNYDLVIWATLALAVASVGVGYLARPSRRKFEAPALSS